jgi:hypothetical protein
LSKGCRRVVEGFSNVVERIVNINHIIQFESNRGREDCCHVYLSDGKTICVAETFEDLVKKINQ